MTNFITLIVCLVLSSCILIYAIQSTFKIWSRMDWIEKILFPFVILVLIYSVINVVIALYEGVILCLI